jgi:hypothetical protein
MASRDRYVEIWIWFQAWIRNIVSLDMFFFCFDSLFWICHVVLIAHSGWFLVAYSGLVCFIVLIAHSVCILTAYSGHLCFVGLVAHFGYVLCCDNSFWICIVLMAHFTTGVFSRPAFLNCFSWVGHAILKIRTLLMMYIIWTVYNYKITHLGWRKDMFLPWQVLDKMSCWTQHAVVLIHHSRQSAVCYEKCIIMRGQFCTL